MNYVTRAAVNNIPKEGIFVKKKKRPIFFATFLRKEKTYDAFPHFFRDIFSPKACSHVVFLHGLPIKDYRCT